MKIKRGALIAATVSGILLCSWLLPPLSHKMLNLCPVRPGPIRTAQAVPSFARKYGISCSECHAAFPALNAYGREFKLNGYVRERAKEKELGTKFNDSDTVLPEKFPWGGIVKSRPVDKEKSDKYKVRAIHELEFFVADGSVARDFSYFGALEFEDTERVEGEIEGEIEGTDSTDGDIDAEFEGEFEGEKGFTPGLAHLRLGYHPSPYLNVIAAFDTFLNAVDPYQTISAGGSHMTASANSATGILAGHHGGEQLLALRGEAAKDGVGSIVYAFGAGAGAAHGSFAPEGRGPLRYHTRVVFDSLRGFALGGYALMGESRYDAYDRSARKQRAFAVDVLAEASGASVRGALITSRERVYATGATTLDNGGYLEAFYTIKKDEKPWIVPLLRYDVKDRDQGNKTHNLVAHASYYFRENFRGFLEFAREIKDKTPTTKNDLNHQFYLQFEVGF